MADLINMFPGLAKMPYVRKFLQRNIVEGVDISSIQRVLQLAEKQHGWKGKDSKAAEEKAILAALELLDKLTEENAPIPNITLHSDGSFGFSWTQPGLVADISIFADGTYSYDASRDGKVAKASNRKASEPLKSDLLGIISGKG